MSFSLGDRVIVKAHFPREETIGTIVFIEKDTFRKYFIKTDEPMKHPLWSGLGTQIARTDMSPDGDILLGIPEGYTTWCSEEEMELIPPPLLTQIKRTGLLERLN